MSKLLRLVQKMRGEGVDDPEHPFGGEPGSALTYNELIDALRGARISEREVVEQFREILAAHFAYGVALYLEQGGPENAAQLRIGSSASLLQLYGATLSVQKALQEEYEEEGWRKKKIAEAERGLAESTPGSTSPESEPSDKT